MKKNFLKKHFFEVIKKICPQISDQTLQQIEKGKSIFDLKIIDSLNLVNLLCELEIFYKIKLEAEDVTIKNFDTLPKIKKIIKAKQK